MGKCNSCSKSTTSCTCKKKPEPCCNSCTEKVSTNCVIYDVSPNRSNLTCFLGVNNGSTLTKILEILDKKLCIPISKCARQKLGLGFETDISMAMVRMLDYICELEDVKVKVTENDNSNGYLFDKIDTGDCVKKTLITDYLGNEKIKIELDFSCIESKLACCGGNNTTITIQGVNTVCGNNSTLLTAVSNCSTPIVWSNGLTGPTIQATAGIYYATCGGRQSNIITVTSTGNCGCIPIWRDAVPLAIFCGSSLSLDPCKKFIKQSNQCDNDIRWVEYTGSNSDGSDCPGCGAATYTATRTQTFVRNNCGGNCAPGSVQFSKTYTSTVSQYVADTLATNDNDFLSQGQAYANTNGTCTGVNCNGCIPTGVVSCSSNGTSISYSNSCSASLGTVSLNALQLTCSGSGTATISASYSSTGGFVPNDYLIEYAITAINGVVQSGVYQGNNQFTNLNHNTSYTISMKTLRGGQSCTVSRAIAIGNCTICNDPVGTISIAASSASICGSGSTTLSATSANCPIIEWYRVNPLTAEVLISTGNSITVSPTTNSVYQARCINCNSGYVTSNTVNITYTPSCTSCNLDVTVSNNLQGTEAIVNFGGATPFSDYEYSNNGGSSWIALSALNSSEIPVSTPGTYTYCARKISDTSCQDCVTFTVTSQQCTSIQTVNIN